MPQTIVNFDDGSQALVQTEEGSNVTVKFAPSNVAKVVSEIPVDIPPAEFEALTDKLMTHTIEADTISGNISVIEPMTSQTDTPETPKAVN